MSFRKIAREAVVFMLLGPIVVGIAFFAFMESSADSKAKTRAASAVNAEDVSLKPIGYQAGKSVAVPLTNGTKLQVLDCAQVHPSEASQSEKREMAGVLGDDCVYFYDEYAKGPPEIRRHASWCQPR